ncbi:hypothetical protein [Leadbetterella byssophila]|uniref:hypothetical protein n=1 Tax=Leadbetterella byssophila TaxID=316068 RepID=UPI00399F1B74
MANKWNTTDIEKISTAFTHKNLEKCFQNYEQISGEDIVSSTAIPQVNYFILREIFLRWEEETQKFKSQYFDFQAEEVQKSFLDFKNTLSRYILVNKENFAPLLESAVKKTLELYMRPVAFFIADFRNLPDFKLTQEWINKNVVFFKKYDWILRELQNHIEEDFIYANHALERVKILLQTHTENLEEEIDAIAQEAGFTPPPAEPENDNLSFFERLVANPPKPTASFQEPEISPFERIVQKSKVQETQKVEQIIEVETTTIAAPPVVETPGHVVIETPAETHRIVERVTVSKTSIFDNVPTLNDKMSTNEGNSLSDLQQRSKIDSLKGSLSLNQRFAFLNGLFGGNLQDFEAALNLVEESSNYEVAKAALEAKFANTYNWKSDSDESIEFFQLVKRRLS